MARVLGPKAFLPQEKQDSSSEAESPNDRYQLRPRKVMSPPKVFDSSSESDSLRRSKRSMLTKKNLSFLDSSLEAESFASPVKSQKSPLHQFVSPSPRSKRLLNFRECRVNLTRLKMKAKTDLDNESKGPKKNIVKIVPKFRVVGRQMPISAYLRPDDIDCPQWVRKPIMHKFLREHPQRLTERTKAFMHLLAATDREFDAKLNVEFRRLTPVEKQTGILSHVPASGAPFSAFFQKSEADMIKEKMTSLMDILRGSNNVNGNVTTEDQGDKCRNMPIIEEEPLDVTNAKSQLTEMAELPENGNQGPGSAIMSKLSQKLTLPSLCSSQGSSKDFGLSRRSRPELLSPVPQIDGQAKDSKPEEDSEMENNGNDDVLEEGEVPESDEDISIVNLVQKRMSPDSSTKDPQKKVHSRRFSSSSSSSSRSRSRRSRRSRRRKIAKRPRSSSSSSSSSTSSRLVINLPLFEKGSRKKEDHEHSVYSEISPMPGGCMTNVRCQDLLVESTEPSPNPPKVANAQADKDDTVYSEVSPMPGLLSLRCQDDLMESTDQPPEKDAKSAAEVDEDILNLGNDEEFESSDDDNIDKDIPEPISINESTAAEPSKQNPEPEVVPVLTREEIGFKDCHPRSNEISRLINGQVCLHAIEFEKCAEPINCPFLHELTPDDVIAFYDIIRDPKDHLLPPAFKKEGLSKINRLLSIYQSQKEFMRQKCDNKYFQLLHYILDDIHVLVRSDEKNFFHICKTFYADLDDMYEPEDEFLRNYLFKITKDELQNLTLALEKLVQIAVKIQVSHRNIAGDLAYSVFSYWLQRGLALQPYVVFSIWEVLIQTSYIVRLPYVANYACERPDFVWNQGFHDKIWKTFDVILQNPEVKNPQKISVLKIMGPTLMSLDLAFLANPREKALLQILANTCRLISQTEPKSPVREFIERLLLSLDKLMIMVLPLEPGFKDVTLENQLLGLVTARKWSMIVDMFLVISNTKYHDKVYLVQKLAEIVTEEVDSEGNSLADQALEQFTSELLARFQDRLLPMHVTILSQLAATLVIHMGQDLKRVLPTVVQARKIGLHPWKSCTFFNPDAESIAIKVRHDKFKVLKICILALLTRPEFIFVAFCDIFDTHNPWEAVANSIWTPLEFYALARQLLDKMIDTPVIDQLKMEKMIILMRMFKDNIYPMTIHINHDNNVLKEIKCELLNRVIMEALSLLTLTNAQDEQITLVLPFVLNFYQTCPLTEAVIRGLVHVLHMKENLMALEFFQRGVNAGIYPGDLILDGNKQEILVYSHYSPYEIQVLMNEAFKQIVRKLTETEIRSLCLNMDDDPDLLAPINFKIRVEKHDKLSDTKLRFLDIFNLTTVDQASQRVFQVMSRLQPPVKVDDVCRKNPGTLRTVLVPIDAQSLIAHLHAEFIGSEEDQLAI